MKFMVFALTALSFTASMAHASAHSPVRKLEAAAVLQSADIVAHLNIEKKLHHLKCEKEKLADVQITDGAEMDNFEVVYGCRSSADDASIQRIHFAGGVYVESAESTDAHVVMTSMTLELNN